MKNGLCNVLNHAQLPLQLTYQRFLRTIDYRDQVKCYRIEPTEWQAVFRSESNTKKLQSMKLFFTIDNPFLQIQLNRGNIRVYRGGLSTGLCDESHNLQL